MIIKYDEKEIVETIKKIKNKYPKLMDAIARL